MKQFTIIMGLVSVMLVGCFTNAQSIEKQADKEAYSLGHNIGKSLKTQGVEDGYKFIIEGLKDGLNGDAKLKEEELEAAFNAMRENMIKKQEEKIKADRIKNSRIGEEFLAKNKTKEGVKETPSGLQYKVIENGTGTTYVKASDKVRVHYRGSLIDGTEFDSSFKRNTPAEFPVRGVIKGWTEALQKMKAGDKWKLFIPASLGYGERGAPPSIGPNEVLIFDVELISIL